MSSTLLPRGKITISLFLIVLSLAACNTVAPMQSHKQDFLEEDEKRLWSESREKARRLDLSGARHDSKDLHEYVNDVAKRLISQGLRMPNISVSVKVLKNPYLNAFAYPHGEIYVHSGLMAAMENEAQLAALLGHEIAHFVNRHAVARLRNTETVSVSLQVLSMGAARAGLYANIVPWFNLFAMNAAVSGYSQSMEWEADNVGFEMVVSAGYDPTEAAKFFIHLERELKDRDKDQPFFFGSHPRVVERRDNYRVLAESVYAGRAGEIGADRFNDRVWPIKLETVEINIAQGRWDWGRSALEQFLASYPRNPRAHYLLGELHRLRNEPGDSEKAERAFAEALKVEDGFAPPHRGLGLLYARRGNKEPAVAALRRYLELAPAATDRAHIENQIVSMESSKIP